MRSNLSAALFLSVASAGIPAFAQSVYRCGGAYSQAPCPGGTSVRVEDARSTSQKAQTDQAALRDRKAANEMEKARLKEEAKPAQAFIPAPKASDAKPAKPLKQPATFKAASPKKPDAAKPKKKTAKK